MTALRRWEGRYADARRTVNGHECRYYFDFGFWCAEVNGRTVGRRRSRRSAMLLAVQTARDMDTPPDLAGGDGTPE